MLFKYIYIYEVIQTSYKIKLHLILKFMKLLYVFLKIVNPRLNKDMTLIILFDLVFLVSLIFNFLE